MVPFAESTTQSDERRSCSCLDEPYISACFLLVLGAAGNRPRCAQSPEFTYKNIGPAELIRIQKDLVSAGYAETEAQQQVSALKLEGKDAFLLGTNLFIGDQKNFLKGNYRAGGLGLFSRESHLRLLYVVEFYVEGKKIAAGSFSVR